MSTEVALNDNRESCKEGSNSEVTLLSAHTLLTCCSPNTRSKARPPLEGGLAAICVS